MRVCASVRASVGVCVCARARVCVCVFVCVCEAREETHKQQQGRRSDKDVAWRLLYSLL